MRNPLASVPPPARFYVIAGVALAVGLWLLSRKGVAQAVAQTAVKATADVANGVVSGVVIGAGEVVGVPETDADACTRAQIAGSTWDASFACPAPRFVRWITAGRPAARID